MTHLEEEDLMLVHYNEPALSEAQRLHAAECAECRARLESLRRVLQACDAFEAPEPDLFFEGRVWNRLAPQLARPKPWWQRWWTLAPAVAALTAAAFVGGIVVEQRRHAGRSAAGTLLTGTTPEARERVLLIALEDHLDRSQMVLAELENTQARGPADISSEQRRAGDLVQESRLIRQTAARSGDRADTSLLEELERVLLEVAHSPAQIAPPELERLQKRIEDQGLLFKVRIIQTNLRRKERTTL